MNKLKFVILFVVITIIVTIMHDPANYDILEKIYSGSTIKIFSLYNIKYIYISLILTIVLYSAIVSLIPLKKLFYILMWGGLFILPVFFFGNLIDSFCYEDKNPLSNGIDQAYNFIINMINSVINCSFNYSAILYGLLAIIAIVSYYYIRRYLSK